MLRFLRRHDVFGEIVAAEQLLLQILYISRLVEIVHFLAELLDRVAGVACRMGVVHAQEDFLHGHVVVDKPFESDELRRQEAELIPVFRRRQQEQDGIQVALFRNDAVAPQVRRQDISVDAEVFILARLGVDAGVVSRSLHGSTRYWSGP